MERNASNVEVKFSQLLQLQEILSKDLGIIPITPAIKEKILQLISKIKLSECYPVDSLENLYLKSKTLLGDDEIIQAFENHLINKFKEYLASENTRHFKRYQEYLIDLHSLLKKHKKKFKEIQISNKDLASLVCKHKLITTNPEIILAILKETTIATFTNTDMLMCIFNEFTKNDAPIDFPIKKHAFFASEELLIGYGYLSLISITPSSLPYCSLTADCPNFSKTFDYLPSQIKEKVSFFCNIIHQEQLTMQELYLSTYYLAAFHFACSPVETIDKFILENICDYAVLQRKNKLINYRQKISLTLFRATEKTATNSPEILIDNILYLVIVALNAKSKTPLSSSEVSDIIAEQQKKYAKQHSATERISMISM